MKTGIVGPKITVERIISNLETKKLFVEYVPIIYEKLQDAVALVRAHIGVVDNFYFTVPIPYHYIRTKMTLPCPVEYRTVDMNAFVVMLFQANYHFHCDIKKVTADFYDNTNLAKAYNLLEIPASQVKILEAQYDIFDNEYPEKNAEFHIANIAEGNANFCLTGTERTYEILKAKGYPVIMAQPSQEQPEMQINQLRLRNVMALRDENESSVISIAVEYGVEQEGAITTELQNYQIRGQIMEKIYYYAQRLDAAVEKQENGDLIYRIYTTKSILSDETSGYRKLRLLDELPGLFGVVKVGIGIGLGETTAEAKRNADFGCERASNYETDCFFIVYDDQKIAGPIIQTEVVKKNEEINGELYLISRDTQVGLDKLIIIDAVLDQYGVDVITPGELARLCELPLNRVNRLITKLESSGYARVIGKKPLNGSGRPSRLVQINLKKRI